MIPKQTTIEVIVRTGDLECRFYSRGDDAEATLKNDRVGAHLSLEMDVDQTRSSVQPICIKPAPQPEPGQMWMHVKTNNFVTILHIGKMQHQTDPGSKSIDMDEVVVYQHDDCIWTRLLSEFMDGRFTRLT